MDILVFKGQERIENDSVTLKLTRDELSFILSLGHEICHQIDDKEFKTLSGFSKKQINMFLADIQKTLNETVIG